ncbi:OLC1v1020763C2 [Oldenlandia corymbosa var. corymbosa]|uniref:OLC1v1020763C2 n=1 Tax=Oldenlandia corymbosa var. corymbosa TaxID=529605 RepID=A0AAV1BWK8_OLDCO|nr:OLC1v1020763C2 [Oldenlandia corymbosa var. corymbosa]
MATVRRLSAAVATCRSAVRSKALASSASSPLRPCESPRIPPLPLFNRHIQHGGVNNTSDGFSSRSQVYIPAILAGLLGFGFVDVAFADAAEDLPKTPSPPVSSPTPSYSDLEKTAKELRSRIEELLKNKGMQYGSYPQFVVSIKGEKIAVRFQVPPACEIPLLIANLVSNLGVKVDDGASGTAMLLRAWDSGVAWQLTLSYPKTEPGQSHPEAKDSSKEDLCILMFRPLVGSNKAEIEFIKVGILTPDELDALASVLQVAGQQKTLEARPKSDVTHAPKIDRTIASLEAMGVRIFGLSNSNIDPSICNITWDNIAGYEEQKREIEDTILLVIQCPEVYDDIARGTRSKFESNRPRAVLFEGPPGTGKTSCARVIANQAGVPLVHVPLEVIMSKYFGESERLLGKVFNLANELPNGAIIFLDEVDSFAIARDGETHEATRRVLSVLLRQIDGFEQDKKVVVVAATNRKEDLDPALISRFDCMIYFGLPDEPTRCEIAAQYAKHLTKSELAEFATVTGK